MIRDYISYLFFTWIAFNIQDDAGDEIKETSKQQPGE